ncbi:MAG: AsmA family protein [Alphaproteobacteria bacterium]|nr:AsmA family protein [Alphaproteobacteria bacterium]
MFWYIFYKRHLALLRGIAFFFMGLIVAIIIALNQVSLESLRGNILDMLRETTNMPIEIDGKISWRFSLRPEIELNDVRVPNADWAKNKNLFVAKKIDVRLDLLSLFKPHPVVRNIKVYDVEISLEKNAKGENSVVYIDSQKALEQPETEVVEQPQYPVELMPFSGLEIQNVTADIYGKRYSLSGFAMRDYMREDNIEYSGWIKPYDVNFPFVIQFSGYNAERKIYPVRIALATGGEALIADVALEGKSKAPIDFVIHGEIPDPAKSSRWFNFNLEEMPKISLNIAGGIDRKKISFRKSSLSVNGIDVSFSGVYDWSKKTPVIKAKLSFDELNLYTTFPEWYGAGKEWIHPNRELNVFHDMPLFGEYLYNIDADLDVFLKRFVVYRSLDLTDMKVKARVKNHHVIADVTTGFADGNITASIIADIDEKGVYTARAAANGEHIYVGGILSEINVNNVISGLPVNLDFYVEARGADMSQIMQTITGPVIVYSVDRGFAHADLVEYMYGGDFLTSLRHNVEDIFTGNKRDMIVIDSAIANVKLRDGLIETQNGVAVETHVINMRLAGELDLGKETIQMSLASVPVRGLKISLSGNLVNAMQITGNLAEPDFKISGAAVAGKVGSAVGIGLLLSPLTGGLSIVGGLAVGLLAGDMLESWLADDNPYKTARKKGAPRKRGDPEWMDKPIKVLVQDFFATKE